MRRSAILLLVAAVGLTALTGCVNFQQRAADAEARIESVEDMAETAAEAAAINTGRIFDLEARVNALEAALDELKPTSEAASDAP